MAVCSLHGTSSVHLLSPVILLHIAQVTRMCMYLYNDCVCVRVRACVSECVREATKMLSCIMAQTVIYVIVVPWVAGCIGFVPEGTCAVYRLS